MRNYFYITQTCILFVLLGNVLFAQSDNFSYQMILESKLEYNNINQNSKLNADNRMNINNLNSISQLYPVFSFKNEVKNTSTLLQVEGNIKNFNFERDSTLFAMQELYGQISFNYKHYITIGKKRLDWGSGVIWNPTNFFVQKDPMRTQNRLEGIFMFNYTSILRNGEINLYVFPDNDINDFKVAVKYNYSGSRMDASLSFLEYKKYQQFGMDVSYGGDFFTAYTEGVVKNFTKSYGIDNYGQLVTPEERNQQFYPEWVLGTSVIVNPKLTLNVEYRHRGDQLSHSEIDIYHTYLPSNRLLYDPISIGKHTFFGSLAYADLYGRWSVNLRNFYDPVSDQLIVSPLGIITKHNFQAEFSVMIYNKSFSIFNFQTQLLVSYSF